MSRLDRHISVVQSKLALQRWLDALTFSELVWAALVWLGIVLYKLFQISPPQPRLLALATAAAAVLAAIIWSWARKPPAYVAALAIDKRLGIQEKFSTALLYRTSTDPFAIAAVKDAERTAENVSLNNQFPLHVPPLLGWFCLAALVLGGTMLWMPSFDVFHRQAQKQLLAQQQHKREEAKHNLEKALATVNSFPKSMQSEEAIQLAKKDLETLLNQPVKDPAAANRTAFKALEQANDAAKDEIKKSDQFAQAQSDQKMMQNLNPSPDEKGPVADAQRAIARGDFSQALDHLNSVSQKFDKMSDAEKQKAAQQMANMAKQLQQMAQNPAMQQQLQQQLQQQTGMSQQQAQQLAQTMQQAAQGNPQAQQQLQQMQQQIAQHMNGGKGPTPQQQAVMQQMMKQMQAQANSQQTAQQMAQAAQQMAQAMQQGAGQQQGQQGNPQQAQQGNQQMAQAQQQMQQAMGQMDAVQKDAEQMAAAQDSSAQAAAAAGQAGQDGAGNNGQSSDGKGQGPTGQWQQGQAQGNGNGMGGPGQGGGGHGSTTLAPFAMKKEFAPGQDIDSGKILASTFVKAGSVKGDSKVGLSQAAEAAVKDAPDEVDEEAVSKESQTVVKKYFETMQTDK